MADDPSLPARAVWLAGPRQVMLRYEDLPPTPPGALRVRALRSAISQGNELLVYRGQVPADLLLELPTLRGGYGFPIKYGAASVGRVEQVGAGVAEFAPGDLVFTYHPHQDVYTVAAAYAVRLPPELDPDQGVLFGAVEAALNIVHDTPLRLGETVIVFGQGVTGLLLAQLLRQAGAGPVFAVDPHPYRQQLARRIGGVDAVLPGEALPDALRAANAGRSADVALEASGAPAALQTAINSVLAEGTVIAAGWYGSMQVPLMLGGHFYRGSVRVRASQVGHLPPEHGGRWDRERRAAAVWALLPRLRLAEMITHRFAFNEAAAAYRLLDETPGEAGQVLLTYEG